MAHASEAELRLAVRAAITGARWPAALRHAWRDEQRAPRARAMLRGLAGTLAYLALLAFIAPPPPPLLLIAAAGALGATLAIARQRRLARMTAAAAAAWLAMLPAALATNNPAALAAPLLFLAVVVQPPMAATIAAILLAAAAAGRAGAAPCIEIAASGALALAAQRMVHRAGRRAFLLRLHAQFEAEAAGAPVGPIRPRTDWLTGLAGPATFDAQLASAWATAREGREPLTLLLADVEPPPSLTHPDARDLALAEAARALRRELRDGIDCLARIDEARFAAILPRFAAADAARIAARMRATIPMPLAIGIADARPDRGGTLEDLRADATEALRRSEAGGCIALAGNELAAD